MNAPDLTRLSLPFPRDAIHWRVQGSPYERNGNFSAMALAYLDARDVMDRLDAVCTPAGWQSHFEETAKGRIICRISIDTTGQGDWVTKSDGAGDTDVEGEKGALSDALKRAAVSWGIGRYLYRLEGPWVACEVTKKGDKTYWKRWSEDPWSKVQGAPVDQPKREAPPAFDPVAAHDRIARKLETAKSLADLADAWEGVTVKEIEAVRADLAKTLTDTKDRLKAELAPKGDAQ